MRDVTFCGDIGSTHMGNMEYCKEAVRLAGMIGMDHIKFQLFPDHAEYTEYGNIVFPLPWHRTWPELHAYAKEQKVSLTASVFSREAFELACKVKPKFVKFGYGMKDKVTWQSIAADNYDIQPIVSCDVMTDSDVHAKAKKLWVHTTSGKSNYPVHDEISFDGLFPRFYGFSDHTLGFRQTQRAIDAGALWIEKHVRMDHADVKCPDAQFAVTFKEAAEFIDKAARESYL